MGDLRGTGMLGFALTNNILGAVSRREHERAGPSSGTDGLPSVGIPFNAFALEPFRAQVCGMERVNTGYARWYKGNGHTPKRTNTHEPLSYPPLFLGDPWVRCRAPSQTARCWNKRWNACQIAARIPPSLGARSVEQTRRNAARRTGRSGTRANIHSGDGTKRLSERVGSSAWRVPPTQHVVAGT